MLVKITTKPFGETEVDEKQIIDFDDGVLGFDYIKKFAILDSKDNSPFKWMQAMGNPELAFIIIRPGDFMSDYRLVVSQSDLEGVGAESLDGVLVFAIVTIPADPAAMTANLQGPIIINPKNRKGRQAISLSEGHSVRHGILDEMKKAAARKG
ncbi:MAG TPA: flagellar assembly protein FliW [Spirochaetota bacterium]|nr:flagellar assembly protein FliW [Spirochaetota bacterium]